MPSVEVVHEVAVCRLRRDPGQQMGLVGEDLSTSLPQKIAMHWNGIVSITREPVVHEDSKNVS